MTDIAKKEELAQARATASQIRQGIHNYLATLALIARANKERHWKVLGYDSWESYVDGEFGAERLRLPAEHRQKAIAELRLSGMSIRAIGNVLDIPKSSVADEVAQLSEAGQLDQPDRVVSRDGRDRPASRPSTPSGDRKADAQPAPARDAESEAPTRPPVGRGDTAAEIPPATGLHSADAIDEEDGLSPSDRVDAAGAPADLDAAGAPVIPSAVQAALDKYVPDPNPHREWQRRYFEAIAGVHRVMRFSPEDVAEKADDECVDELLRVADALADYRLKVVNARILPDNVTPMRRTS